MRRPRLWEWVALVAVAGVVWAIVAPVFKAAGPISRRSTCLSMVKQASLALILYQNDADDRFPRRDFWIDAAYPYARSWALFHCPTAAGSWGYAFNGALDRARTPGRAEAVPMVYDSVNPAKNASDLVASLPAVPRHVRNSVDYADGHAKSVVGDAGGAPAPQ